jgi:type IV secretion system protein VirB1
MAALDFLALFAMCAPQVHPATMQALIETESSFQVYAVHVNGDKEAQPAQPTNQADATALLTRLLEQNKSVDVGLGQVNSQNFAALGLTPESAFDPCTNLNAAAQILTDNYTTAQKHLSDDEALPAALSAYNTGNQTAGITNGYVQRVQSKVGYTVPALQPIESSTPVRAETPVRLTKITVPNSEWSTFARAKPKTWDVYSRQ